MKGPITYKGKFDHLFVDDRDPTIENAADEDIIRGIDSWGNNGLNKPDRALTEKEAASLDKVGTPNQGS